MLETGKIINGNCIEEMSKLPECCVDLIVTSPPYGVGIEYDVHNDDMEIEDFDKPHDFTGGNPFIYFTNSSCKGCQGVYGLCQLEDGKYPMTWLDVWKVIDRIRGLHPNCDHRFIEDITEDEDGIFIQFGS